MKDNEDFWLKTAKTFCALSRKFIDAFSFAETKPRLFAVYIRLATSFAAVAARPVKVSKCIFHRIKKQNQMILKLINKCEVAPNCLNFHSFAANSNGKKIKTIDLPTTARRIMSHILFLMVVQ